MRSVLKIGTLNLGIAVATAAFAGFLAGAPAHAQLVPSSEATTVSATINAIDFTTRQVRLAAPSGYMLTLTAGPSVDLSKFSATEKVVATYARSVAFAVSMPGAPLTADDTAKFNGQDVTTDAGKVKMATVSGTITGINLAAHSIDVVDPTGGAVFTVDVIDPDRIAMLSHLKVGDTVTAMVSPQTIISMEKAS